MKRAAVAAIIGGALVVACPGFRSADDTAKLDGGSPDASSSSSSGQADLCHPACGGILCEAFNGRTDPVGAPGWAFTGTEENTAQYFKIEPGPDASCPGRLSAYVGKPVGLPTAKGYSRVMSHDLDGSTDLDLDVDFSYDADLASYEDPSRTLVLLVTKAIDFSPDQPLIALGAKKGAFVLLGRGIGDDNSTESAGFTISPGVVEHLHWVIPTKGGDSTLQINGISAVTLHLSPLTDSASALLHVVMGVVNGVGTASFTARFDDLVVKQK